MHMDAADHHIHRGLITAILRGLNHGDHGFDQLLIAFYQLFDHGFGVAVLTHFRQVDL